MVIKLSEADLGASIVEGPNLSDRRRQELALVPMLGLAVDVILNTVESDLDVRVETARALIKELQHVYPETMR